MDISQIKHLLAKYAEGNTTLLEEQALQSYFAEESEIDTDLLSWKSHFMLVKAGRDQHFDTGKLESAIMNLVDKQVTEKQPSSRRIHLSRFLIAASITLMIGIAGIIFFRNQINTHPDTFTDPQLAYNETQKALLYISQKMNKGIEPLSNISKINTGNEQLKNLEKMDQSLGMLNLVSFINRSSNLKK